jgi:dTDP-L-rhamnose 4-epimerase
VRVLVTGGAGFIGAHVTEVLLDAGHDVVVLDSLHPAAHRHSPDHLDGRADYQWESVTDPEAVMGAVRGCDAVSHQAAMVGLGVDFTDVLEYVTHNDLGTATLLRALHDSAFAGRLVLASSMAVYGEGSYRCPHHDLVRPRPRTPDALARALFEPTCPTCGHALTPQPVPEDAPAEPRNVYAATKLHQEHLCAAFTLEHPTVAATALRYHNVYGPHMPRDTPYAGVASIFRSALERGDAPRVYEDGGQLRDFIHVQDVARANLLALTTARPVPGPINIATGHPHTVLDAANTLRSAFGNDAPPPFVTGAWRPGDVRHVFASTEHARTHLGFTAEIPYETGIRELATAPLRA